MRKKHPNSFYHPSYWPIWAGYALVRVLLCLPFSWQLALGRGLGRLAYYLAPSRRHIARVNLDICFPDLPLEKRRALLRQVFLATGMGMIETANAWITDANKLAARVEFQGLEHLRQGLKQDKGVLLIGMHFSTLDLCGAALSTQIPFDVMYRRNKNPLLEHLMTQGRERNFPSAIERSDIRAVLKHLKQGHAVWYGPDQDYGRKHSVFVPFFGEQAATITATARFAKISGAPVIVFSHRRTADHRYVIEISEPLADYPCGDEAQDARRINEILETAINKAPEQYWWIHRRFKTRPEGEERPYKMNP